MLAGRISGRIVVMPGTPGEAFALYAIDGCGENFEDGIALLRWLPVPGLTPDPAVGAVTLVAAELARRQIVLRDSFFHRSEEHTSELQSLMRISYAVFCLKKKHNIHTN